MIARNTKKILIISLSLILFSCEKVIEVSPVNYIEESTISSKNDAERLLIGCYDGLQSTGIYSRYMIILPDLLADNLTWEGTTLEYGQFENNTILADNFMVEGMWNAHYDVLNRVNYLLAKLPEIDGFSPAERDDMVGQLHFLRALCHFNLLRLFGAIPIKTSPTSDLEGDLNPARQPEDDVYNQIFKDLLTAEDMIMNTDPTFATNGAVQALLAKAYLSAGMYDEAVNYSSKVINSMQYELEAVFPDLYNQTISTEAIFLLLYSETDGNRLAEYFFPTSQGGRYEIAPSPNLTETFSEEDSIRYHGSVSSDENYGIKYPNLATRANNVYVLRLADIYLVRAEAESRRNGDIMSIQQDINIVRNRAGLDDTEASTHEDLMLVIEKERRRELAFEGHRWFDLIRTGRAMMLIETITSPNQLLMPIPTAEIQVNTNPGMYQNPGY
jgi:hypothetical protein